MSATLYLVAVLLTASFLCASSPPDKQGPLNLSFSKMAVFPEEPCTRAGGWCMEREECPEGKLAGAKGLCPEQEKRDVGCCYGAPRSLKDCQGLGGFCTSDYCNENNQIKDADDCQGQICCALVH